MLNAVNEAFKDDLFTVYYQEIMENPDSIRKGKMRKFECLVRMYDSKEKNKIISPGKFRPIIIRSWKNQQLTDIVISKVSAYMQDNTEDIFSINITEDDLNEENSAEHIYGIVSKYNINPRRIIFEILEDIEDMGSGNIIENIKKLKSYGFEIAIDDFWTWYSNFSRIFELAPDYLKIDMQFIRWIDTNILNRKLVKYIVWFSHDTWISVVAEWVETANEQLVVQSLGVDFSQWYFFSKPNPVIR